MSQDEFKRGNYDRVETADGFVYVPKTPGMPIIPIMGAGGEQLTGKGAATEDQAKAAGFALRMNQATQIFKQPIIDPNTNKPFVDEKGMPLTMESAFVRVFLIIFTASPCFKYSSFVIASSIAACDDLD